MKVRQLHPCFVGEVSETDVARPLDGDAIAKIHAAMSEYGVLVFRDQAVNKPDSLQSFAASLGKLDDFSSYAYKGSNRGDAHIGRVTNLDANGRIAPPDDRILVQGRANLLWHIDSSFRP